LPMKISSDTLAYSKYIYDGAFLSFKCEISMIQAFALGLEAYGPQLGRISPGNMLCCDNCGRDYPAQGIALSKPVECLGIYVPGLAHNTRCPDCGALLYPWLQNGIDPNPAAIYMEYHGDIVELYRRKYGRCSSCSQMGTLSGTARGIFVDNCMKCIAASNLTILGVIYEVNKNGVFDIMSGASGKLFRDFQGSD
jgi:hypothetical protein